MEEGKGEVGMDHYETRSWRGWHHHMAQTFLAHLFLMRLRLVFKKNARADYGPSTPVGGVCYPAGHGSSGRYSGYHRLPSATKLCSLSLSSQADTTPPQTTFSGSETLKSRSNAKSRSNIRWIRSRPTTFSLEMDSLINIARDELAQLTEEYGGPWGINHTRRLLELISIIGEGQQYNADALWWRHICTIGVRTANGRSRASIIAAVTAGGRGVPRERGFRRTRRS